LPDTLQRFLEALPDSELRHYLLRLFLYS
jgi:hypothetical protein